MNLLPQTMLNSNPISNILGFLNGGANPQAMIQNMLNTNPQAQQMLSAMQKQCGNRSPRDFVLEQCRNRGISEQEVMQLAQKIGAK